MTERDFDFKEGDRSKRPIRVNANEYESRFKGIDERLENLLNFQKKFFEDLSSSSHLANHNKSIVDEIAQSNQRLIESISSIADELSTLNRRQSRQETLLVQLMEQIKKDRNRRSSSTLFNSPKLNRKSRGRKSHENKNLLTFNTRISKSTGNSNKRKREANGKDSREVGMSTDPSVLNFPELPCNSARKKNRNIALKSMKKRGKKQKDNSLDNRRSMKALSENLLELGNSNRKGAILFSRHADYKDIPTKDLCQITHKYDEEEEQRLLLAQLKSINQIVN